MGGYWQECGGGRAVDGFRILYGPGQAYLLFIVAC